MLTKQSDRHHVLSLERADGSQESIRLVSRETLFHDLLHFAVESTLPTQRGFWGTLAGGKTLADLNDRSGEPVRENRAQLNTAEGIVGLMTGVVALPADKAFARLRWYSESQDQALPEWCTEDFVATVCELMRQLLGRWRATAFGESMAMHWRNDAAADTSD